jgi:membrane dipeptidase
VIGLNLLAPLVLRGWKRGDPLPAVEAAIEHVEYLAALTGPDHVGIGADLAGGLTPENTPAGINRVTDLPLLGQALGRRGWRSTAVQGFMGANWWRFFERSLPA